MKVNFLLILLFIITIVSCSGKIKGIIVNSQKVVLYNKADTLSKKSGVLKVGDVVEIVDSTTERFSMSELHDLCTEYPYVKVSTKSGKTGWISGEYIFRLGKKYEPKHLINSDSRIKFENQIYSIHLGRNYGTGSFFDGRISGCNEFFPIVLFNEDKNSYHLIKNIKNPNSTSVYSILISNYWIGEEINSIKVVNSRIIFKIDCTYQEGGCTYEYAIKKMGDEFSGESYNLKSNNVK